MSNAVRTAKRLWADENIRRDEISGAYYAEYFTDDGWVKLGAYHTYDDAIDALVVARCRR